MTATFRVVRVAESNPDAREEIAGSHALHLQTLNPVFHDTDLLDLNLDAVAASDVEAGGHFQNCAAFRQPDIVAGMRLSLTVALILAVVCEIWPGSTQLIQLNAAMIRKMDTCRT